jgi:hypothetical protein
MKPKTIKQTVENDSKSKQWAPDCKMFITKWQLYHWENKSHLDAMMDSACTKTNTFR